DRLCTLGFASTPCKRLGDDGLHVVDVVEVTALELVDRRVEIARNCEVDQEQRPAFAGRKNTLDVLTLENPPGRGGRGDDDVGGDELLADVVQRDRGAAEATGQLRRAIGAAVCDPRDFCAPRKQVARGQIADLSRADDEDLPAAQVAEHLLGQRSGGGGHGSRTFSDRRLHASLSTGVQRLAEKTIEDRSRRSGLVRSPDLTEDLTLTWHHRIEPSGNAKQVQGGSFVAQPI